MVFFKEQTTQKGKPCLLQGNYLLHSPRCFWLGPTLAPPNSRTLVLLPQNQTALKALACLAWRHDLSMFIFPLQSTGGVTSPLSFTGIAYWVLPRYSNSKFATLALSNSLISVSQVFLLPQSWFSSCFFSPINTALKQKWPLYDIINAHLYDIINVPFAGRILFHFELIGQIF